MNREEFPLRSETQQANTVTRHARRQAAVAELGQEALAGADVSRMMDDAAALVARTLNVEYCAALELLADEDLLLLRAGVGWKEGAVGHATGRAGDGSPISEALRDGTGVPELPLLREHGIVSGLTVTIPGLERPFGVLGAYAGRRRTFTADEAHFLRAVANILSAAIERKRAEHVSQGQMAVLARTLNALSAKPDLDTFLGRVLAAIAEQLRSHLTSLWFYDPDGERVSLHLTYDGGRILSGGQHGHPIASEPHISEQVPSWQEMIRTKQPVVIDDVATDPRVTKREWLLSLGANTLLLVPLLLDHEAIGWLGIACTERRHYRPEEIELAQALAQQATLAVQLTRLVEQGRQAAVLQERNRMAREIHDTLAQGFTGIVVQLEAAEDSLADDPQQALARIARARDLARESLAEARRSVWALRPQALEHSHLPGALAALGDQMTLGIPIQAEFRLHGTPRLLPSMVEDNLLRIATEALTNALKHAQARQVQVELTYEARQVRLSVRDDGRGFDPGRGAAPAGFGLTGMRERAERLGGSLTVTSEPGRGTRVSVVVPQPAPEAPPPGRQGGAEEGGADGQ